LLQLQARSIQALSGGERQLATVARALAQEPQILLLDEPTSHLDLSNRRRLLDMMQRLRQERKTVLFTTHDPNEAAAIADHVVLLRKGQIEATGRARETLTPEHLQATYGVNVEVVEHNGRPQIIS
jgi:iron complex transport system ATP-binding protein